MKNTQLAGIAVSPLCFGSLPLSPLQRQISPADAGEILAFAFENSVNFVDTAEFYQNYPQIAAGLQRTTREIVVATKTYAYTADAAAQSLERARTALNRDVIDIFLLHEQESEHTLRGHAAALEVLYAAKAQGKIRAVGISTHHIAGVRAATAAGLDVVHPLINIAGRGIADGSRAEMEAVIAAARQAGLGVYTMKTFGGGTLVPSHGAADCLRYAVTQGDAVALGLRDADEVAAALAFFCDGNLPAIPAAERTLWIADWCVGCGKCVESCKGGALTLLDGKAVCTHARCVLCGYCAGHCPDVCLKIV